MNPVYIRVFFYFAAPLVALLPGVEHNQDAGTLVIDIETAVLSVSGALAGVTAVFAKWGKK